MARLKEGFKGERAIIVPSFIKQDYCNDELGRQLHITDIGFYPHAKYHHRERKAEEAGQYIFIYCIDGEGWYTVSGIKRRLQSHQFIILPKHVSHAYGSDLKFPWSVYWIHFDGKLAGYFAQGHEIPVTLEPGINSRIEERLDLFEEIFITLSKGYSTANLNYSSACLYHFLGSVKFLSVNRNNSRTNTFRDEIDLVIHYMRENISNKMTLGEMAKHAGLSASHFSALFHEVTGYSPMKYLNHLRIQKACHYLDFTDMKVNQICPNVGFDDPFYFSRTFNKIMGISPSEYRALKKG
ncbi:MAG: AraC family transcriptional regulator [Bacteroidales bacterium]|nr:AraC family transcriptional regulator [Bacteroidales bacterium]MBN2698762.1 AraC family transcriptional regulator [Bacteroidales bacterium]